MIYVKLQISCTGTPPLELKNRNFLLSPFHLISTFFENTFINTKLPNINTTKDDIARWMLFNHFKVSKIPYPFKLVTLRTSYGLFMYVGGLICGCILRVEEKIQIFMSSTIYIFFIIFSQTELI